MNHWHSRDKCELEFDAANLHIADQRKSPKLETFGQGLKISLGESYSSEECIFYKIQVDIWRYLMQFSCCCYAMMMSRS